NSHRNIEPKLIRIILANNCLDQIISHTENDNRLFNFLKILKKRKSSDSIDISDEFESQDLFQLIN
ncbi:15223_t:CDS:1, partial [Cetraspora pellucida]